MKKALFAALLLPAVSFALEFSDADIVLPAGASKYHTFAAQELSKHLGMITMEQSHFNLYMAGQRGYEQTLPYIRNRDLLRQMQANEAAILAKKNGLSQPVEEQPKKRRWF